MTKEHERGIHGLCDPKECEVAKGLYDRLADVVNQAGIDGAYELPRFELCEVEGCNNPGQEPIDLEVEVWDEGSFSLKKYICIEHRNQIDSCFDARDEDIPAFKSELDYLGRRELLDNESRDIFWMTTFGVVGFLSIAAFLAFIGALLFSLN